MNYLDEIRKQIDIECQTYLNKVDVEVDKEKAIQQQEKMINVVNLFQTDCLSNLTKIQYGQNNTDDLEQSLNSLYLEEGDAALKLERDISCSLFQRQKLLFMNKGVVFLDENYLAELFGRNLDILFGVLLIVEDEFLLNNDKIQHKSE